MGERASSTNACAECVKIRLSTHHAREQREQREQIFVPRVPTMKADGATARLRKSRPASATATGWSLMRDTYSQEAVSCGQCLPKGRKGADRGQHG